MSLVPRQANLRIKDLTFAGTWPFWRAHCVVSADDGTLVNGSGQGRTVTLRADDHPVAGSNLDSSAGCGVAAAL